MKIASGWTLGLVAFVALPSPVKAESHRICLVYQGLTIWDASARFYGDDAGEDHGRRSPVGDPQTLLQFVPDHLLVRVANADQQTLWGWRPVGPDGCTGTFDAQGAVKVHWVNWSYWPETDNSIATVRCGVEKCEVERDFRLVQLLDEQHDVLFPLIGEPEHTIAWAASNAEGRASYNRGTTTFGVYWSDSDPALDSFPGARTTTLVGGKPTMEFKGASPTYSKYTIAHEYGHVVTLATAISQFAPGQVDLCFDPDPNDVPPSYGCAQHTWDSPEWQSAAILEGFADFYSLTAWNDLPDEGFRGIPKGWANYDDILSTLDLPDSHYITNLCVGIPHCDPGVANERDWAYFLWDVVQADLLTLPETMDLLEGFHPNWPLVDSPTDATWQAFRLHASSLLSPAELAAWDDLAQLRGIDN